MSVPSKEIAKLPNKEIAAIPPKPVALVEPKIKTVDHDELHKGLLGDSHIPISSHSCDISRLPTLVQDYIEEKARVCQPDAIYVCDGSEEENKLLLELLERNGWIQRLEKEKNK